MRENFYIMSDLRRFFIDKISEEVIIEGEEFRHAVSVLRIREGEDVILLDNSGLEYFATITSISKKNLTAKVYDKKKSENEPKNQVVLVAGYLKGDKTELVVQKAVELGVSKIIVFSSEFSSAYINENKLLRLNKVSQEASKQCRRAISPEVIYKEDFASALESVKDIKNKLFACEFATENKADFSTLSGSTAIVVGSEGGFSTKESELALEKGFTTVYLGKRILRAETACISLTAIVMHSLKELE